MSRFPTTKGGAAGSFVRGNEFAQNAPAPYSNTRRGRDTIHVTPQGVTVVRPKDEQLDLLPTELLVALPMSAEQVNFQRGTAEYEDAFQVRRLHGATITPPSPGKLRGAQQQRETWLFGGSTQQIGRMCYVGDGYFVSIGHAAPVEAVEDFDSTASLRRPRVALIHKLNLSGPYLSTTTRTKHPEGASLALHKRVYTGDDRGRNDKPSDKLKDARGANYYLQECEDLMQRTETQTGAYGTGFGPKVSVVALGWVDDVRRYAFAVYGLSNRDRGALRMSCYVYCTGTRALMHDTTEITRPGFPLHPDMGSWHLDGWVGMASMHGDFPRLAGLGVGKMALVLIPITPYIDPDPISDNSTYRSTTLPADKAPMLVFSEDFGRTWEKRELPELRALAMLTDDGSYHYPPLHAQLTSDGTSGGFMLGVAAMNADGDDDIPDDPLLPAQQDMMKAAPHSNFAGITGGENWFYRGYADRFTHLTLLRGSLRGAVSHVTGLDSYRLRFDHWPSQYYSSLPDGTYRYNVLMNGSVAANVPYMQALGERHYALMYRTIEVVVASGKATTHTDTGTYILETTSAGSSWAGRPVPPELVSYPSPDGYRSAGQWPAAYDGWEAILPGRTHLPWCVTKAGTEDGVAQLAVLVLHHAAPATLRTTKYRAHGSSPDGVHTPWLTRELKEYHTPSVYPQAYSYRAWDQGRHRATSQVLYVGNSANGKDGFRDWLDAAHPDLYKKD